MGKSIEFFLTKGKKGWASEQKTHGKQVFFLLRRLGLE
jgi:hypothetical protein